MPEESVQSVAEYAVPRETNLQRAMLPARQTRIRRVSGSCSPTKIEARETKMTKFKTLKLTLLLHPTRGLGLLRLSVWAGVADSLRLPLVIFVFPFRSFLTRVMRARICYFQVLLRFSRLFIYFAFRRNYACFI